MKTVYLIVYDETLLKHNNMKPSQKYENLQLTLFTDPLCRFPNDSIRRKGEAGHRN